jgi:hypothetical protein
MELFIYNFHNNHNSSCFTCVKDSFSSNRAAFDPLSHPISNRLDLQENQEVKRFK